MDLAYLLCPLLAWLIAGLSKLALNSMRAGRLALDQIGYGGMPSNHSAIVSSMVVLIGLREGIAHPAFGVALTAAFIVMLDASSLRRHIGRQAEAINRLSDDAQPSLRERMGHSPAQIAVGALVGGVAALLAQLLFSSL